MSKFHTIDPFINETLNKLKARSRQLSYKKIEKDTGLSYDWLAKFCSGRISDPSYSKIKVLSEYLNNN